MEIYPHEMMLLMSFQLEYCGICHHYREKVVLFLDGWDDPEYFNDEVMEKDS